MAEQRAVVLLSGGLDSATVLAMARRAGRACYALSFDYGQRQASELEAAGKLAEHFACVAHRVVRIDMRALGGSALTSEEPVPKHRTAAAIGEGVPTTYVPARNTVFLAYALAWAEVLGAPEIHIGVNAVDYSGYPDCRPEFIAAFTALANVGTAAAARGRPPYRVCAPLQGLGKAEIIAAGTALGVNYAMTRSCYDPRGAAACGACDACILRRQGFSAAGLPDPTPYVAGG